MRRVSRLLAAAARWALYACVFLLLLVGIALAAVETSWGKDRLRQLIVSQANQYLTATLEIGRLEGSLLRGIQLGDVRLSRGGETIIRIDDVSVAYSIRELFDGGTSIREIRLARPVVVAAREPDGRWNLASLIKRDAQRQDRRGPRRPLHLLSIEVTDGSVAVRSPLKFGAVQLPSQFDDLDLRLAFNYEPVEWRLDFEQASWIGRAPDFSVGSFSGSIANEARGWRFEKLRIATAEGRLAVDGALDRTASPSILRVVADADRFAFQEWAQILPVISRIGVVSKFHAQLEGPLAQLATTLDLQSDGGNAKGKVVLNTTVPGWRFAGAIDVSRLDLAPWLSRADQASDISGHVQFDLGVRPGAKFPYGTYDFDGSHARFKGYEADDLRARGHITATEVHIAEATATAYGANVRLSPSTIGINEPYPFAFNGVADGVDLRRMPANVPVPHVESTLRLTYDVTGRFSMPFLVGSARFSDSEFLGATIGGGAVGTIDTSSSPFRYAGEGDISGVDLHRFGEGLAVTWLQEPRYAGVVAGHFHVDGAGGELATMTLSGGGRLHSAKLFDGTLSDADVTIEIADGSLTGSYDGDLANVNPAIAMDDGRYESRITGKGRGRVAVRDLLVRAPELADYSVTAALKLTGGSRARTVDLDRGTIDVALRDGLLTIGELDLGGPALDLKATGTLALDDQRSSDIQYAVVRSDLARLRELTGRDLTGQFSTTGRLTGPMREVRLVGQGALSSLETTGISVLTTTAQYQVTIPTNDAAQAVGTVEGRLAFLEMFGQQFKDATGTVAYNAGQISTNLSLVRDDGLNGTVVGQFVLHSKERTIDISTADVTIGRASWTTASPPGLARISWDERGISVSQVELVDSATRRQHVSAHGTWYPAGGGSLRVIANDISLDSLLSNAQGPARYGGIMTIDTTITGSRDEPLVTGHLRIVNGRVWRTPYELLAARVNFRNGELEIDLRIDQSAGIWLSALGTVPLGAFRRSAPDGSINLAVTSSRIGLGLIEGATTVVRSVSGEMQLNVRVVGTARDPHFDGRVDIDGAAFQVAASGSRYRNGRLAVQLATDRVTVETLHIEDDQGDPLDVQGSLATHELRVGDLAIAARARSFEVLRNQYGRLDIDANVSLLGQFESPRLDGRVTVSGGELAVDAILDRTMFQPYATSAIVSSDADAIAVLNPWERMGLGLEVNVPGTLRLVGDNVQVSPGTPIGLGDINLRAIGDLYLYKDPAQPLYVTGSLDSLTGTYRFQGRRFDLDPQSSITFRGDLNPELYVTVRREISGVETRVTIAGALREPELRLASTPPLDPSDILSLIVFNTSTNDLSALEQQQLAVRAGTLAAGFLAAPIVTALERSLGLDTLEIEPVAEAGGGGTRVTIGNELAPGLVARFSRQFGEAEYDEASLEYYLSRLLRIRATFSDANGLATRSLFRRVERAGIDLLIFFSF